MLTTLGIVGGLDAAPRRARERVCIETFDLAGIGLFNLDAVNPSNADVTSN